MLIHKGKAISGENRSPQRTKREERQGRLENIPEDLLIAVQQRTHVERPLARNQSRGVGRRPVVAQSLKPASMAEASYSGRI